MEGGCYKGRSCVRQRIFFPFPFAINRYLFYSTQKEAPGAEEIRSARAPLADSLARSLPLPARLAES